MAQRILKRCLSTRELAEYLGISPSYIQREYPRWVSDFGVRVYKIGVGERKKLIFEKEDVDKLLERFRIS